MAIQILDRRDNDRTLRADEEGLYFSVRKGVKYCLSFRTNQVETWRDRFKHEFPELEEIVTQAPIRLKSREGTITLYREKVVIHGKNSELKLKTGGLNLELQ